MKRLCRRISQTTVCNRPHPLQSTIEVRFDSANDGSEMRVLVGDMLRMTTPKCAFSPAFRLARCTSRNNVHNAHGTLSASGSSLSGTLGLPPYSGKDRSAEHGVLRYANHEVIAYNRIKVKFRHEDIHTYKFILYIIHYLNHYRREK